ncbi:hypothetical protein AAG906_020921 [Vitis piasezkii]
MGTNKERIEHLETGLGLGMIDKLHHPKKLSIDFERNYHRENQNGGRQIVSSKSAKLEFPRFWRRSNGNRENQKVPMVAYHLEGGQPMVVVASEDVTGRRTCDFVGKFEEELWAHFGPSGCEDFDEALSRIKQLGTLRDYQREFEKLGNRVQGWTQKALVGTFMGGLKTEIADGIRMFKPLSLKEVINLARMRDDQLARQRRFMRLPLVRTPIALPQDTCVAPAIPAKPIKRLSWEEMQRKRAQGLCFNCNERFTAGHRCQKPQLLLLEGHEDNMYCGDGTDQQTLEDDHGREAAEVQEHEPKPEITLHALTGWTAPKTMRVTAKMGPHEVMVLIDKRIDTQLHQNRLANMLSCHSYLGDIPRPVANGERLTCRASEFYLTLFSRLIGLDLVLGVQWLEILGSVVCNRDIDHGFYLGKSRPKVARSGRANHSATSPKKILKEFRQGHALFAVCFQPTMETAPVHAPTKVTQQSMQRLLKEYEDVFEEPSSLPPAREVDHCITLKEGTEPINVRPYRYAHFQKAEIEKQVQEIWRFCTNHRTLNRHHQGSFPIPTMDDMLEELYVRVNPSDVIKTAFRTHNGHYEYLVMPFGLCNAPSTFQAIMNSIFRPYLRKFILVFFDDILVYSPTWDEHMVHVRQTLETLRQHQFFAKASKCVFGQQELEYLGHIVTHQGVKVDNSKKLQPWSHGHISLIFRVTWFLGLQVLRNSLLALKQAMTTTPTLAMPNFNDSFTIETDASRKGIGIEHWGYKKSWSTHAKEMLAIVEAIRLWRPYLLGKKFFILTDQRSLKYFLEQRVSTPEQQKWVVKLMGYDYEIIYRPGRENSAADALSRKSGSPVLLHLHVPVVTVWDEIKKAYEGDSYVQSLTRLANDQLEGSYAWRNGLLFFKGRVVIPSHAALRAKLLHEMHDTKIGGHSGVLRTFKKLAQQFYWPKMYQAVQEYIKKCETCQKVKSETMSPAGLLQPLPIPCQVWDDITLDFIEGLPTSHGKDTILVVVDRLSKSAHFLALTHPFTAKIMAERFSLLRTISVIQKIGAVAYKLQPRKEPAFIPVFHVSLLKISWENLRNLHSCRRLMRKGCYTQTSRYILDTHWRPLNGAGVLIGHDDPRGAITKSQIFGMSGNVKDRWTWTWVVAVESPTCEEMGHLQPCITFSFEFYCQEFFEFSIQSNNACLICPLAKQSRLPIGTSAIFLQNLLRLFIVTFGVIIDTLLFWHSLLSHYCR